MCVCVCAHAGSPVVHWTTPRYGSIAGGTVVTIHGGGFSSDTYISTNLVFFGSIPCDVIWYGVPSYTCSTWTRWLVLFASNIFVRIFIGTDLQLTNWSVSLDPTLMLSRGSTQNGCRLKSLATGLFWKLQIIMKASSITGAPLPW